MSNLDWYRNKLAQARGQEPTPQQQAYAPRPSYGMPPQQVQPQQFQVTEPPQVPSEVAWANKLSQTAIHARRGGKGHLLNPDPCPECGSPHFYSNLGPSRGPQPAPHCWNCGYNGLFEQGMPSSWGATVG